MSEKMLHTSVKKSLTSVNKTQSIKKKVTNL